MKVSQVKKLLLKAQQTKQECMKKGKFIYYLVKKIEFVFHKKLRKILFC